MVRVDNNTPIVAAWDKQRIRFLAGLNCQSRGSPTTHHRDIRLLTDTVVMQCCADHKETWYREAIIEQAHSRDLQTTRKAELLLSEGLAAGRASDQ